jgi:hypothetical protein
MIVKKTRKVLGTCDVTFQCDPPGASKVDLVCDALRWEPFPMHRVDGKGPFQVRLQLRHREVTEFRYLIDDTAWLNDGQADGFVPNEFGTENSVVIARPLAPPSNLDSVVRELGELIQRLDDLCASLQQLRREAQRQEYFDGTPISDRQAV